MILIDNKNVYLLVLLGVGVGVGVGHDLIARVI